MRRLARNVASILARIVPRPAQRLLGRATFYLIAQQPARAALEDLLKLESDLAQRQNEAATRYDGGVHVKHRLTRYHDFFVERVAATERVLDIGCGVGALAASISRRTGARVTAIDLSRGSIEEARARYADSSVAFVHGDALNDKDLAPQVFDVVVLSNVLEHIEHRPAFLRTVQARFRPRRWLLRVPMIDRDWRVPLRQELGLFAFNDPTHYVEYTRTSFEAEMAEAGLSVCHLQVNWGEIWAESCANSA